MYVRGQPNFEVRSSDNTKVAQEQGEYLVKIPDHTISSRIFQNKICKA